ncbi:conserved oligomeric golgi complex subunit 8 [Malassezia pachydermatis]|uniref:Conserved oligomeric Golgi complex subunit 8 n=1 Tax=Malassezia pachydermatis TaxID=77020 RepID=A0A0M8MXL7_9BASI|nr:conserved oligomeric golgi complex subunit 8 [Malassezia pachydermatis]KOS15800.1 conserved oligomeric golgi complex subunit 8 [Malassezia pachydermatis]
MAADGAVSMLDAPLQVLESLHLLPSSAPGDNRVHRREVARYLRDLARTPLDVVEQHPAQQQSAAASLEHQLLDLSLRSTHTFVDIQSACNEFPTLFEACDTTFSSLTTQHAPKVEDAARLFHTTAQKAMASRKAMERMDDVLDTALLPLLQYPTLIRACVAQAQYEEALQLMQRYFDVLPAKDGGMHHIIEALHTDMHHVLLHVQHVFLEALATPSLTLAQARSYTHYLARSIQLRQHTFSETPSDLQMPDVCFAFLYTRQRRLQTVLEHESPVLDVIERWRTLMLSTCTMTLSLFMDSPITDTDVAACTQLFASFTVLAIETLYAFVSAHLRRSWTPTDAVSTWEATTEGWAELYAKLCVTSDSLSDVGAALCLSMITEPSMEAGASNVWESTALQLWRAALRAVRTEPVAPVPSSSSKPSDVQHVPPSPR